MQENTEILILIIMGILAMLVMVMGVIVFVILYYKKSIKTRLTFEKIKRKQAEDRIINITEAQESERKRISSHLHDEIGASLSSVNLLIGRINYKSEGDTKELSDEAGKQLNQVITEIRKIVQNMSPSMVERFGFIESTHEICKQIDRTGYIKTSFTDKTGSLKIKNKSTELILYRIVQELTNNVVKHSKATQMEISTSILDDNLFIKVSDNGIGLPDNDIYMKKSLGVTNIKSRIEILNGSFELKNNGNKGVRAEILIPIEKLN